MKCVRNAWLIVKLCTLYSQPIHISKQVATAMVATDRNATTAQIPSIIPSRWRQYVLLMHGSLGPHESAPDGILIGLSVFVQLSLYHNLWYFAIGRTLLKTAPYRGGSGLSNLKGHIVSLAPTSLHPGVDVDHGMWDMCSNNPRVRL